MKTKDKKDFFDLRLQYKKAFSYLGKTKNYIYFSAILFFLSIIVGYFIYFRLGFFDQIIKSLVRDTSDLRGMGLIGYIFWNNLRGAFLAICLGILFGIFPVIYSIFNGLLVGYVIKKVTEVVGFQSLWTLVPHGIFELPAMFIAFGIGIKLGLFVFSKKPEKTLREDIIGAVRVFILVILILLIIAAIIEGTLISVYK